MKKLFLLLSLLFALSSSIEKPSLNIINNEINNMIFQTTRNMTYEILAVSAPKNDLVAVAIEPPYREFPNIIIFKYINNSWQRTYETFSVGIEDVPSLHLDLHTLGNALDLTIGEKTNYFFDNETKTIIEKANNESILIPYKNFLHMHLAGKSPYIIDKTNFYDLANQLFDNRYAQYEKNTCIMYDLPKITEMNFSEDKGIYTVSVHTDNGQFWEILFEGIDPTNKYFLNKTIHVKKSNNKISIQSNKDGPTYTMSRKLYELAWEYEEYAPVPRVALTDFSFGYNKEEFNKLNGYGILMITSINQDQEEHPIKKVYIKSEDQTIELHEIAHKQIDIYNKKISSVLGANRIDYFYLLPYDATQKAGTLLVDWNRNRTAFEAFRFPADLKLNFVDKNISATNKKIDKNILKSFAKREFELDL